MPRTPSAPALQPRQWSTDTVVPDQRFDYWVGAICEAFLEMDCSSRHAQVFEGTLTSVAVDALSFNRVLSSPSDVYRTQAAITRGQQHPFYLITHLHSAWHVRQGAHAAYLRPGDAVLIDSAQRYELHYPESVTVMSVQLPRQWVGQWLSQVECAAPRVVLRDQGWGQSLSALCMQLGHNPLLANDYPAAILSDQLGAMLASSLEPQPQNTGLVGRSLVSRAQTMLSDRFDQTGVTAEAIACELGISVRTLHRSFATLDTSFATTLKHLRLNHATRLLLQPRLAHLTTAEIGRRCGFADASHFVREFQATHAVTPARWRKQAGKH